MFTLYDDSDTLLSSGVLKQSLSSMFRNGEDEVQFEHKEYLICIEQVGVNPKEEELIQPQQKEDGDLVEMLQPRAVSGNPLSGSVDILLSILHSSSSNLSTKRKLPVSQEAPPKREMIQKKSILQIPESLPEESSSHPQDFSAQNMTPSDTFSLPTYAEITSKNLSYFSLSTPLSTASPDAYSASQRSLALSVIRYTLFQTLAKFFLFFVSIQTVFSLHTAGTQARSILLASTECLDGVSESPDP